MMPGSHLSPPLLLLSTNHQFEDDWKRMDRFLANLHRQKSLASPAKIVHLWKCLCKNYLNKYDFHTYTCLEKHAIACISVIPHATYLNYPNEMAHLTLSTNWGLCGILLSWTDSTSQAVTLTWLFSFVVREISRGRIKKTVTKFVCFVVLFCNDVAEQYVGFISKRGNLALGYFQLWGCCWISSRTLCQRVGLTWLQSIRTATVDMLSG